MYLKIKSVQINDRGTFVDAELSPNVGGSPSPVQSSSIEYETIEISQLKRAVEQDFKIDGVHCEPSVQQFAGYVKDYLMGGSPNTTSQNHTAQSNTPVEPSTSHTVQPDSNDNDQDRFRKAIENVVGAQWEERGYSFDDEDDEERKKFENWNERLGGGDDAPPEHVKTKANIVNPSSDGDKNSKKYGTIDERKEQQKENNQVVDHAIELTDFDKAVSIVESDESLMDTIDDWHALKPTYNYQLKEFTRKVIGGAVDDSFFNEHKGVTEDQAKQYAVELIPDVMESIKNEDEDSEDNENKKLENEESNESDESNDIEVNN